MKESKNPYEDLVYWMSRNSIRGNEEERLRHLIDRIHEWKTPMIFIPKSEVFDLLVQERQKQIVRGYNAAHDDTHTEGELAQAAAYYALSHEQRVWTDNHNVFVGADAGLGTSMYPFEPESFKDYPDDRIQELVIACSLLIAEIERRQRLTSQAITVTPK